MKNSFYLYTRAPIAIQTAIGIEIVFCLSYLLNIKFGRPYKKINSLLNLDGESSIATWFSSMQLFLIFILSFIFVIHKYKKNKNGLLFLLVFPSIFLLMSIDEVTQIHEWLGTLSDRLLPHNDRHSSLLNKTGIWMFVIGLPFTVIFIAYIKKLKLEFCKNHCPGYNKILFGMLILLLGALGIETLSNFVTNDIRVIQVAFEEGIEMLGATIILWGMLELTSDHFPFNDSF